MAELPPVPTDPSKRTRDWLEAAAKILRGLVSGGNRAVRKQELIDAGVITDAPGGGIALGSGVPTRGVDPVKITGLTASGAMDNIFLSWDAPSFENFSHTEVWRSSTPDVGTATKIGWTSANAYPDPIGAGATRYYWVRAVRKDLRAGPWSDMATGKTAYNPAFVKTLLTGGKWQALTAYDPFQYVRPSTDNEFQYYATVGGTSGNNEPSWPTTAGQTVVDGTVTWRCASATERIPFVIGTLDGDPAVYMWAAFIENASIESAKIKELNADKIRTGILESAVSIRCAGKIWSGFEHYGNPNGVAGWWIGTEGDPATPKFMISTAGSQADRSLPDFWRRISFDGSNFSFENVDLISSSDGEFDDLAVDTLTSRLIIADTAMIGSKTLFTRYVADSRLDQTEEEAASYMMHADTDIRGEITTGDASGVIGNGWARFSAWSRVYATVPADSSEYAIIPYNEASESLRHAYDEHIGFRVKVTTSLYPGRSWNSWYYFRLVDQNGDTRLEWSGSSSAGTTTATTPSGGILTIVVTDLGNGVLVVCSDDNGLLSYTNGTRLSAVVSAFNDLWVGSKDDATASGTVYGSLQIIAPASSYDGVNPNTSLLA